MNKIVSPFFGDKLMICRLFNLKIHYATLVFVALISTVSVAEEKCLSNAWKAFNTKQYIKAAEFADECISQFVVNARRQQSSVRSAPPCGKVSDQQKASIHQRGLLNDVTTAAWIKAKSAQKLGNTEDAGDAMALACELNHGRTWDPNGWFWAPCDGSCP